MNKICQHCGQPFNCNTQSIEQCFCNEYTLPKENKRRIPEKITDCLCEECLSNIALKKTEKDLATAANKVAKNKL
jgi:hypothetical protein